MTKFKAYAGSGFQPGPVPQPPTATPVPGLPPTAGTAEIRTAGMPTFDVIVRLPEERRSWLERYRDEAEDARAKKHAVSEQAFEAAEAVQAADREFSLIDRQLSNTLTPMSEAQKLGNDVF